MAIPAFMHIRERSQNTRVANDLRVFSAAFELYVFEKMEWPPDAAPGEVPAVMAEALTPAWTQHTSVGGQWKWDYDPESLVAITLYHPTAPLSQMLRLDALIDDGNPATGHFRVNGSDWNYILEE